jgi:hypothetical protein
MVLEGTAKSGTTVAEGFRITTTLGATDRQREAENGVPSTVVDSSEGSTTENPQACGGENTWRSMLAQRLGKVCVMRLTAGIV